MPRATDLDQLRRHSVWLARLTLFLFVATFSILVLTAIGIGTGGGRGGQAGSVAWRLGIYWSPTLFYLYALWSIRRAFGAFGKGGVFGPAMAAGCTHAGWALAVGAGFSAVGVPNLMRALHAAGLIEGGLGRFGAVLQFDTAYLAVGVVGLALVLLGRLLGRAAELQSEAARLRAELGEFF